MYNSTEHNNNNLNIKIIPKISMDDLMTKNHIKSTASILDAHNDCKYLNMNNDHNDVVAIKNYNVDDNDENDNNDNKNDVIKKNDSRPTYGAYLRKTLPRGPYLQYKFNDYQTTQSLGHQFNDNNDNNRLLQLQIKTQSNFNSLTTKRATTTQATNLPSTTTTAMTTANTLPRAKYKTSIITNNPFDLNCYEEMNKCNLVNENQRIKNDMRISSEWPINSNVFTYKDDRFNENDDNENENYQQQKNDKIERNQYYKEIVTEKLNENQQHQDKRNQIMSIPNDVMYLEGKIMLNNKNYWNNGNISQQRNIENEPEINLEIDLHQADNNKQLQSIRRNHFLKQIQQKNSNMMTRMTTGIRTTAEKAFTYTGNTNNHVKNFSTMLHAPKQIVNEVNYITLADVMRSRSEGLNEIEGWAILCQAVQALQDMFLGDFPTTSKILPLVKTTTIQITSRGRIVFNIITLSQLDKFNDVSTSSFNVTDHLSPEYRNNIGKSMFFAESDMEKMWIYSLGIALRDTIDSNQSLSRNQQKFYKKYLQNDDENNYNRNIFNNGGSVLSITEVIDCMCKRNIHQRASLMYLLDVISLFCREHKQMKPFSHIVMEIFQSIINHQLPAITEQSDFHHKNNNNNRLTSMQIIETNQISDSVKSETDSGRSSAHGERDLTPPCIDKRKSCLKVRRDNNFNCQPIEYDLCGTIGYSIVDGGVRYNHNNQESANNRANQQLQVFRKNRKDIWKKKNDFRRNTIDVSCFDIEKAKQIQQLTNFNLTNSTEFVSKLIGQSTGLNTNYETKDIHKMYQPSVEGTSLPDLCPIVQPTNTNNLNFIGNKFLRSKDIKLSKAYSEGNFTNKLILKRPEFVVNSKLPAIKEICITESKCQHKKNVNVILLNGQIIKIICNSITTTTRQILETIFQSENYIENFFIGLCAFIGGDFVFLPSNLKIYKVAPQSWINSTRKSSNAGPTHLHDSSNFTLYIRIKFLLPTLRGISSLESRHMLYLQLRKSILERHILCTNEDLINLGGIALQAEMGDFKDSTKYDREEYFIISHYLPEGMYNHSNKMEMVKYLRSSHFSRKGLHPREAEQMFIKYIQDMKDYGFHLYSAIWTTDDGNSRDIYLGISLSGMSLFDRNSNCNNNNSNRSRQQSQLTMQQTLLLSSSSPSSSSSSSSLPLTMASGTTNNSKLSYQRKLYMNFEWLEIENLCYSKHILCIVVRKSESLKAKDNNRVKYKLKMDGRKSYFAFSLASEHHQFYMKLRNSFISLKSLSSELNIPITFHTFKDKSSEIEFPSDHRIATTTSTSTSTTKLMANIPSLSSLPLSSPSSSLSVHTEHHTVGIKTTINDANTNLKNQTEYDYNNRIEMENPITKQLDYIKKIDKQLKASGMHVKNLKKSMLNDNRLTKLKDRLLKRSKSTAGTLIEKVTSTIIQSQPQQQQQQQQQNKNPRYRKQGFFRKSKENTEYKSNEQNDCRNENDDGHSLVVMPSRNLIDNIEVSSKEENQNKENECPVKDYITDMKKSHGVLLYSPNRNRVKMGTRVFYSTQFLNKSLDNIYEPHTAVFNLCQFKSTNSLSDDKKSTENNYNDNNGNEVVSCDNRLTVNRITTNSCTVADECNIRNCTKYHKLIENINHNDNGNLTCYIEKLQNVNDKFDDSIILPSSSSSSSGTEAAFVIHSSIKSDRDLHYNFTIPNETLSESLLEKFENISCSSSSNNDRILMKLTVVKERLNQTSNHLRSCEINKSSSLKGSSSSSSIDDLHYEQHKRSDTTTTTTTTTTTDSVRCVNCNPQTVKKCSHENENLCENFKYETNKIGNGRKHSSSTCLLPTPLLSSSSSSLLSNKQHESIFIGHHKFETDEQKDNRGSDGKLMTERMTINHQKNMENDLDGFTLGISVVQGSDNNVYVKDLIKNGSGDKAGIRIGDQIIAVNGISLLNLSYNEALKKLQNTGLIVELIVSQVLDDNKISSETNIKTPPVKCNYGQKKDSSKRITRSQSNIFVTSNTTNTIGYSNNDCHDNDGGYYSSTPHSSHDTGTTATTASISTAYLDQINRLTVDDIYYHPTDNFQFREMKQSKRKDILTPAKSMPDLPKVVAIIPKRVVKTGAENQLTYPRTIDWFPVVKVPVVSSDNFITNSICKCLTCHPFGNMNTICNKDNLPRPKPSQEIKTISSLIDKFTVIGNGRPISSSSLSSQPPPPHLSSSSFLPPLPSLSKFDPNNYYNCYEYNRNVQQIIDFNTKDLTTNKQNRHFQHHHHNHHVYNNNNNKNFNIEMKHERFTPCQPNTTITNNNNVLENNEDNIDADDAADGDIKIATNAKISSCSTTTTEIITITPNIRISSVKHKVTTASSNKLSTSEEKSKNDDNKMAVVVVAPPRRKKRTNKKQQQQFQELVHSNGSSTDMSSLETNLESMENNNNNDAESREVKLLNNLDRPSKKNVSKNYVDSDQNNNCGSNNDNNNNDLMHIKTDIIDNIKEQTNNVLNINNIDFNNINNNIDNNKSINNNNNNKSGCSSVDLVSSSLEKNILNLNINNSTMTATTMPKTKMTISNNSVTNKYTENINTGSTKIPDNFSVNNGPTPNHTVPNSIGYSKYNKVYYKESNVRDSQKYPEKSCSHCGRGMDMNMTENTMINGENYVNDDDYYNNNNYTMDDIYNDEILVCESIFTFNGNDELKTRQIVPLPSSSSSTSPAELMKPPPPPKDSTYTKFCSDSLYCDKSFEADEIFTNSSFESQFEDMINRLRNEKNNNNYRLISSANLMSSSPFKKFCLPKQNKRRTRHNSLIKDFGLLPSVHRTTAISKTNNNNVQVTDEPVVTTEDEMIIEEEFDHHHHNHHHHSQKPLVNNATNTAVRTSNHHCTVAPDIIQHENSTKKNTSYRYHDTKLTKCSNDINSNSTIIHSYKPKCIRKIEC